MFFPKKILNTLSFTQVFLLQKAKKKKKKELKTYKFSEIIWRNGENKMLISDSSQQGNLSIQST